MITRYFFHQMTARLVPNVNRAQRREVEHENKRIIEKLDKICVDFESEISKLYNQDPKTLICPIEEMYSHIFISYNSHFQGTCDWIMTKNVRHHGIHRGFFFMMYAPEKIGVQRNEDFNQNTIGKLFRTPIEKTIATILS
jgi:hypothetical protein